VYVCGVLVLNCMCVRIGETCEATVIGGSDEDCWQV